MARADTLPVDLTAGPPGLPYLLRQRRHQNGRHGGPNGAIYRAPGRIRISIPVEELQPRARQLTPSASGGLPCLHVTSWRRLLCRCAQPVRSFARAAVRCCSSSASAPSCSSGCSARATRSRRPAMSATSRKARSSARAASTAFRRARRRPAAPGCSTSPTSASRPTPTPRSSPGIRRCSAATT